MGKVQPYDMFGQSCHIETVVLIQRKWYQHIAGDMLKSLNFGTISTPHTLAAFCARNRDIVPIPQYKSHTTSSKEWWKIKSRYCYSWPSKKGMWWKTANFILNIPVICQLIITAYYSLSFSKLFVFPQPRSNATTTVKRNKMPGCVP